MESETARKMTSKALLKAATRMFSGVWDLQTRHQAWPVKASAKTSAETRYRSSGTKIIEGC
jgi:hypothetical protein